VVVEEAAVDVEVAVDVEAQVAVAVALASSAVKKVTSLETAPRNNLSVAVTEEAAVEVAAVVPATSADKKDISLARALQSPPVAVA